MATPMVAGTVARMLEKDPTLTPATIKARLMRSARKFSGDAVATGAGLLDIDAALEETGTVASPVSVLESGIVTLAEGVVSRTIMKVAVTFGSDVFPDIAETVIPRVSLSRFVRFTSSGFLPP